MNLCNHGHDEVCFEGRNCPVCEMETDKNSEISKLEDKISELENQIGELEGTIEDLSAELKESRE